MNVILAIALALSSFQAAPAVEALGAKPDVTIYIDTRQGCTTGRMARYRQLVTQRTAEKEADRLRQEGKIVQIKYLVRNEAVDRTNHGAPIFIGQC